MKKNILEMGVPLIKQESMGQGPFALTRKEIPTFVSEKVIPSGK